MIHSNDAVAPVGYLNFKDLRLVEKEVNVTFVVKHSHAFWFQRLTLFIPTMYEIEFYDSTDFNTV